MSSSPDYSSELLYKIDDIPPTGGTSTVAAPLIMAGPLGLADKPTELGWMIGTTFVGKG